MDIWNTLWHRLTDPGNGHNKQPPGPDLQDLIEKTRLALYEKRVQSGSVFSKLHTVDTVNRLDQEPTIIVLPGNSTIEKLENISKNKELSGTARFAERSGYHIMPVAYGSDTGMEYTVMEYKKQPVHGGPQIYSWNKDTQDLINRVMEPNIPDLTDLDETERKNALIKCFKGFRNLKIFSNSYGGIVTDQLNSGINALMTIRGYSQEEQEILIPQIMTMGIATVSRSETEAQKNMPQMTAVHLKSLNDVRLLSTYSALSAMEIDFGKSLTPPYNHGIIAHTPHQIGFYSIHDNMTLSAHGDNSASHNISTYLTRTKKPKPSRDGFPVAHEHLWDAMTTQNTNYCMQHPNLAGATTASEQWDAICTTFRHPIAAIMAQAQENPDFAIMMRHTKEVSYTTDKTTTIAAPVFAADYTKGPDINKLQKEMNHRIPEDITNHLLTGKFEPFGLEHYRIGIPAPYANDTGVDNMIRASMILFHTKFKDIQQTYYGTRDSSGNHEILETHYRGIKTPRYLVVEKQVYENYIAPMQTAWKNNTENEDIHSIRRQIHENHRRTVSASRSVSYPVPPPFGLT